MLFQPPSIVLSQLISLVCRFISCNDNYPTPVASLPESYNTLLPENETLSRRSQNPEPSMTFRYGRRIVGQNKLLPPIVSTESGIVEGYYMTVISGRKIYAFEGIPYAEPPIKDLRFKAPKPKSRWNGTLETKNPGAICIQLDYGQLKGHEDCLRLNIYSNYLPHNNFKPNLPVIIFLHGGAFIAGSASKYGPAYLLEEDLILVTLNYRLGIMGAFSTGDEVGSGNWGLKDQALAINWIYKNIEKFGGSKTKLNICGQSAGSVSAHLQMMSPLAKDKLSSAILISGGAYNFWGVNTMQQAKAVSVANARLAFCPDLLGSEALLSCMRKVSAETLVANQLLSYAVGFPVASIEPNVTGAFLSELPDELYLKGKVAKIPMVITSTDEESNFVIASLEARGLIPLISRGIDIELPYGLQYRGKVPIFEERRVLQKIKEFYDLDRPNGITREFFTKVANDRYFLQAFHKTIQMHSQIAPTYAGVFSYANNLGSAARLGLDPKKYGVSHNEDTYFFLNSTKRPPIARKDSNFAITKLIVNVFKNFIENGEPSYTSEEDGVKYKFWDVNLKNPEDLHLLRIDEEVKMIPDQYQNASKFWESLGLSDTTSYLKLL